MTPEGRGSAAWDWLAGAERFSESSALAAASDYESESTGAAYLVRRIDLSVLDDVAAERRLRRSSPVSLFAAAAALDAVRDAKLTPEDLRTLRCAVILAVGEGGVRYTR